ncbi:MAG: DUF4062 domain-containing protein [Bacteroidetes bacterium]|nr:DUF4062 domain-containing protein [Bacteroidota bacterium]
MIQQNSATRLRPVIRVFVSSTFSDMKHERNALQDGVFPKLEQLCLKNGFQFQAIDLRWGVSGEAGLDHRTMRICFDELRRAQEISPEPNFLVLLGDRYGWRPLPEEISQGEFNRLMTYAKGENKNQPEILGIHGKSSGQILEEWYRCDHNMVLTDLTETAPDHALLNYILQPRTLDLGDGRDYKRRKDDPTKDTQDWMDIQQVLWSIINAAFPFITMGQRFEWNWPQHVHEVNDEHHPKLAVPQIARFQASATEQEIWCGALSAVNAEQHVIACYREITNRDDFDPIELVDFYNLKKLVEFDSFSTICQSDLKVAISSRLGDNTPIRIPFSRLKRDHDKLVVEATKETTNIFCDEVFNRIKPIIERQIEEYWEKSKPSSTERVARELNIERNEHKRFGRERGGEKSFVGRKPELQAIRDYLKNNSPWPLVIHGASGCGKTALLARAVEEIPENQRPIIRFIGTTPYSSDIRSLLLSLCQELRERYPRQDILPLDTKALQDELHEQLQIIPLEQPLILFLDALDQLSDADNGRLLIWIPYGQLPPNVKLVISCLSDRPEDDPAGQPYIALTNRLLPKDNIVNLDVLTEDEANILLFRNWLAQAGRKLSDLQQECIRKILKSKECCQPIYLKLLFEEARLWRSYYAVPTLGTNLPSLLRQLFARLSLEENHGYLLVERVLGYLAASRYGLSENEILEILFDDPEYKAKLNNDNLKNHHELPIHATRIPIAIWSRLRFDLAPYLAERGAPGANVLTFYHKQVAEWVEEHFCEVADRQFLSANAVRTARHQQLATYFHSQDYFLESLEEQQARAKRLPPTTRPANVRKVDEMPWQRLSEAKLTEKWSEIEQLFTDLFFLEAKVEAGLVFDLAFDFAQTLRAMPIERPRRWHILLLEEALRRDIHFIDHHPTTLFQCMWNLGWWSDCPDAGSHYMDGTSVRRQEGATLCRLLESWRLQKDLAQPGFNWLRSCRPPFIELGTGMIAAFSGHTKSVTCVSISSDGKTLASASVIII